MIKGMPALLVRRCNFSARLGQLRHTLFLAAELDDIGATPNELRHGFFGGALSAT